ncbi:MAG: CsgG/HfaB family protein [Spirochaetaceae bacterium]|jgi:TolB-like protein|nr:CsgG/HfaB family protein [Spirochaetaceae bacterium]
MIRKLPILFILALVLFFGGTLYAQSNLTLDQAINESMMYLSNRLEADTKVAVLNFASPAPELSNYVIEELTAYIVNDGTLTIVDRSELELLEGEMDYQLSGEVSDETAQAIGKKVGAQTIISGSMTALGSRWRVRIKALEVETAKVLGMQTYNVKEDSILTTMIPKDIGEKIGIGAMNILFGLGSWLNSDPIGGATISAGWAVSAGLIIAEATALDWDSPMVGVPGTIGIITAGVSVAWGFVRPFLYYRAPTVAAALDNVSLAIVPASGKDKASFSLSYTVNF